MRTYRGILPLIAHLLHLAIANPQMGPAVSVTTVTVKVPVGTCAVSSVGVLVPFTTTDAEGHTVTGSSTSYSPVYPSLTELPTPSLSPIVVGFASTDASGHIITGSSTSYSPVYPTPTGLPSASGSLTPSLSPSVVSVTSTDASGHTVVVLSTTLVPVTPTPLPSASGTTLSAVANPSSAAYPCPAGLDTAYIDAKGNPYTLFCNTDFLANDLPAVNAATFAECIDACTAYVPPLSGSFDQPCVAVTWAPVNPNGANCYLKSAIQNVIYGTSAYYSAKILTYSPVYGSLSVSVVTPTATVNTFTIPTTFSSYQPASPCPVANDSTYTDTAGVPYVVQCGIVYIGDDLPAGYTNSFQQCMFACSSYIPPLSGR
ncbi:mucin 5B, oligomeric mucus gel-forming [Trapelia coarctata]|nr:mucin 5B, oligomeric mucus gel-forming [Trapelia coarctata]